MNPSQYKLVKLHKYTEPRILRDIAAGGATAVNNPAGATDLDTSRLLILKS